MYSQTLICLFVGILCTCYLSDFSNNVFLTLMLNKYLTGAIYSFLVALKLST